VRFLSPTRLVAGFEHETDARRYWDAMLRRLQEFELSPDPDKTRLLQFGRHAARILEKGSASRRPSTSWALSSSVGVRVRASSSSRGNPGGIECRASSRRSRRSCGGEGISLSPSRGMAGANRRGLLSGQRTLASAKGFSQVSFNWIPLSR
jgi:hypothetical protein